MMPAVFSRTCARVMPMARQPNMMFRSPERSLRRAAFTPSRVGWPFVYSVPPLVGSSPAIARSRVDLPEPLLPISPIASPR